MREFADFAKQFPLGFCLSVESLVERKTREEMVVQNVGRKGNCQSRNIRVMGGPRLRRYVRQQYSCAEKKAIKSSLRKEALEFSPNPSLEAQDLFLFQTPHVRSNFL